MWTPQLTITRPLDTLTAFQTDKSSSSSAAPVRYAVRQVLDQEFRKKKTLQESRARQARSSVLAESVNNVDEDKENEGDHAKMHIRQDVKAAPVKRDFFGRIINEVRPASGGRDAEKAREAVNEEGRVWVSFHEGFSNAVRKPITLKELLDSF